MDVTIYIWTVRPALDHGEGRKQVRRRRSVNVSLTYGRRTGELGKLDRVQASSLQDF